MESNLIKAILASALVLTVLGLFILGNKSAKADLVKESGVSVQVSSTVVSRTFENERQREWVLIECASHIVTTGDFSRYYCEGIAEDDEVLLPAYSEHEKNQISNQVKGR